MSAISDRQRQLELEPWTGPKRHYDIVKEGVIALVVVSVIVVACAALIGSPDVPALTFKGWATDQPQNFVATTVSELAGTTESAGYGGPYNANGDGQAIGPINPAKVVGVHIPIDTANDFVINPLKSQQQPQVVTDAITQWESATPDQRITWATNLDNALNDPNGANGDPSKVPNGDYGPVPNLATGLMLMAQSGALDGILPAPGQFYNADNTKQILFMGDGSYLDDAGTAYHLQGDQWGMMNETGNYPGQQWLMPFSFWYQLPIFNSDEESGLAATLTANGDIYILTIIGVLFLVFMLIPFIPGLRSIPRWIPVHRLIWRSYYRRG